MTSLSAAMYLSGIPVEHFGEDFNDIYSFASKCLDCPNKLTKEWKSSSSLSCLSVDSGYCRSLVDEPVTLLTLDMMEQKTLADLIEAVKNFEVWETAHSFLRIIEDIEKRYYVSNLSLFPPKKKTIFV